jgi:DNA-binding NarL/FixJ family response regulator
MTVECAICAGDSPPPRLGSAVDLLTEDEVAALREVATGATLDAAAERLCISPRTLRRRIRSAADKARVGTMIEAVLWAERRGLLA